MVNIPDKRSVSEDDVETLSQRIVWHQIEPRRPNTRQTFHIPLFPDQKLFSFFPTSMTLVW